MLVTDATRAAGMEDGEYDLGGQAIRVEAGVARLADGTLAGSLLTMDGAVRNAVAAGLPLERASALASAHPARYLGLGAKGRLEVGYDADLVALGERLEVLGVYVEGERVA
jgi:N-acetylglucosamine-6-phosphate deacetylase